MRQTNEHAWVLPIQGMTCASCAGRIERALAAVPGASAVQVNLASDSASLRAPADALPPLVEAIREAGYQVTLAERELQIEQMTCASCAGRVERALARVPGVLEASVNLASEKARVRLLAATPTAALEQAVAEAGYRARPLADQRPGLLAQRVIGQHHAELQGPVDPHQLGGLKQHWHMPLQLGRPTARQQQDQRSRFPDFGA